ncbi:MAG: DUF6379 domain-containing protein [Eubacteriales bacterium]
MDFQAYNKILITDKEISNVEVGDVVVGYEFKIKYPSYRGTFLSCIEELRFEVDGELISKDAIYFILNGKQFLIDEIPECYKEYWFVRESATIRVNQMNGITKGEHKVNVYMKHRVPYTGYFGEYLVLESNVTEQMKAR